MEWEKSINVASEVRRIARALEGYYQSLVAYDPIEGSPDWYIPPAATGTTAVRIEDNIIYIKATGALEVPAVNINAPLQGDGACRATVLSPNTGTAMGGFTWATRVTDGSNYVGARQYNSVIQVFQKVGGAFTQLDGGTANVEMGDVVEFSVIGTTWKLRYGGNSYTASNITLGGSGYTGLVSRVNSGAEFQAVKNWEVMKPF